MNYKSFGTGLIAKGMTAPRITPDDVEANIVSEYYFTAGQGAEMSMAIFQWEETSIPDSLDRITFCVLVLRNEFTVTGESVCSSLECFDDEIGRKIARKNAVDKVRPLMVYALKSEQREKANQTPAPSAG